MNWWHNIKARLDDFKSSLDCIYNTNELSGLERVIAWISYATRILSIPFWLLIPFEVESETASEKNHQWLEVYLVFEFLILVVVLASATRHPRISSVLEIYFLLHIYFALFDIVFVSKLRRMQRPVISVERSLFIFIINAAEIVVAFSVFYSIVFCYGFGKAILTSLMVFATVGHPLTDLPGPEWGGTLVAAELLCDFVFVAIFLSAFIAGLRPGGRTKPG